MGWDVLPPMEDRVPPSRPDRDSIARLVVESALDVAIVTADEDGRVTSWNIGAERLFGWSEADMVGQDSCLIFTPEDRAQGACEREQRTAADAGRAEDERWHVRKDGSRFWASGLLMPLEAEEGGGRVGFVKILRDRTERHREIERHLEHNQQTAEILESISDAFYAVDADWRFTYLNRRAEQLWGRSREELLGKVYWDEFPHARVSEPYLAHVEAMTERRPVRVEVLSPTVKRWVDISIHPTEAGGLSVYFRDISGRRERELRLQQSEARLRLAIHAARLAIWEYDIGADRLEPSDELAAFLGLPTHEVSDLSLVRARYPDGDEEKIRNAATAALARGDTHFDAEFRFHRSADDLRWFLLLANFDHSPDGKPLRIIGALVDITERKDAEDELRALRNSLEEQVQQRTRQLFEAEEALRQSQKMEAIGQLTGGVAHDFNNLLTIIRSSVDLLRRPEFSEERKARYVDAISETVDRAAKLTGQLLAFARRQALQPTVFDLAERTRRIADLIDSVSGPRVSVELNTDCNLCFVDADPSQFETAIVNLAANARDAMNDEGVLRVVLSSVAGMPTIRSHHAGGGDYVAISLSDTGPGIAPDVLPHIFEPFFTTKDVGKGTGLGLSQVYGFAKQSGGDIEVESKFGGGTTFTLYLPRVPPPASTTEPRQEGPVAPVGRCRILIVEDNVRVGEFATQLLQELGHQTTLAPNAHAALDILAAQADTFDLVFTDVIMPGMSGVDLAKEVRRRYPRLRIILTSGYSDVLAEQGTGGFELLKKPYSIDALTRLVNCATG